MAAHLVPRTPVPILGEQHVARLVALPLPHNLKHGATLLEVVREVPPDALLPLSADAPWLLVRERRTSRWTSVERPSGSSMSAGGTSGSWCANKCWCPNSGAGPSPNLTCRNGRSLVEDVPRSLLSTGSRVCQPACKERLE